MIDKHKDSIDALACAITAISKGLRVRMPDIEKVIFSDPATIIFWEDGTKTVVKTCDGDYYDPEKGMAMAIAKKAIGNTGSYRKAFKSGWRITIMKKIEFAEGMQSDICFDPAERTKIIKRSLRREGADMKSNISMEEMAELQKEISKQLRGKGDRMSLMEEMADVWICLKFLQGIFHVSADEMNKAIDVKLQRERERCMHYGTEM